MYKDGAEVKRPFLSSRALPLAILLLVTVLLSLFMPDFFRQVILAPILPRVAILYGIYRGIPENVMWGIFIFVALWIMLYALRPDPSEEDEAFEEKPGTSRLSQLATIAADARTGQHARWELAREIQQVIVSLMKTEPGETAESLQERIQQGELKPPPEVTALLNLCVHLPNYRSFLDARDAAPRGEIPQLANLDLAATLTALEQWRQAQQEQFE